MLRMSVCLHSSFQMRGSVHKCRCGHFFLAHTFSISDPIMQGFFDAHPNLEQRFPGGILQFAQAAAQLPPDVLEELMLMEAMGDGGMPGEMPGFDMRNDGPAEFIEARAVPDAQDVQNHLAPENNEGSEGEEEEEAEEEEEEVSVSASVLFCW